MTTTPKAETAAITAFLAWTQERYQQAEAKARSAGRTTTRQGMWWYGYADGFRTEVRESEEGGVRWLIGALSNLPVEQPELVAAYVDGFQQAYGSVSSERDDAVLGPSAVVR